MSAAGPDMLASLLSLLLWLGPPVEPDPAAPTAASEFEPEPELVTVVPAPPPEPARVSAPILAEAPETNPESDPELAPIAEPPAEPPDLHFHWEVDVPLLLGAGAIWLGTELNLEHLVPAAPRWRQATAGDLALREALIWGRPTVARTMSDALAYGVIPVFGLTLTLAEVGATGQWRRLHEDLIIVLESVAVAAILTQGIKLTVARGRPYTYEVYNEPTDRPYDELLVYEPDSLLSFPSGHANLAFAFVTSFATVATMRERKLAPYLWGFGIPLASFVAYLRVAGHRHWFGDVVIGSTIGAAIGAGLPLLLHHPRFGALARLSARKREVELSVAPSGRGIALVGRF